MINPENYNELKVNTGIKQAGPCGRRPTHLKSREKFGSIQRS